MPRSVRDRTDHEGDGGLILMLVGDTNVQNRTEPATAFSAIRPLLTQADVLFGHLEGPLTAPSDDPLHPDIAHKTHWRHSHPKMVEGLKAAGFAAMSCASNVTYPPKAAVDTAAALRSAGIEPCGAGSTLADARRPAVVERGGVRFGFLSYTSVFWPIGHAAADDRPGVATVKATTWYEPPRRSHEMPGTPPIVHTRPDPDELAAMEADIRALRSKADIVTLSCHWGVSGSEQITDYQQIMGRAAIDAGADLVIGHHPHVIQPVEVWKGRPIFYSLANFAFDWPKMGGRNLDGLAVIARVNKAGITNVSVAPVRRDDQNEIRELSLSDPHAREIFDRLARLSSPYGARLEYSDGRLSLVLG